MNILFNNDKFKKLLDLVSWVALLGLSLSSVWPRIVFFRELFAAIGLGCLIVAAIIYRGKALIKWMPARIAFYIFLVSILFYSIVPAFPDLDAISINLNLGWTSMRAIVCAGLALFVLSSVDKVNSYITIMLSSFMTAAITILAVNIPYYMPALYVGFNRNDSSFIFLIATFICWLVIFVKPFFNRAIARNTYVAALATSLFVPFIFLCQKNLSIRIYGLEYFADSTSYVSYYLPWALMLFGGVFFYKSKKSLSYTCLVLGAAYLIALLGFGGAVFSAEVLPEARRYLIPMIIASLTVPGSLLLLCNGATTRRIAAIIGLMLFIGVIIYAHSRNCSMMAILSSLLVIFAALGRRAIVPALLVGLIGAGLIYHIHTKRETMKENATKKTENSRLYIWHHAVNIIKDNSILGAGYGYKNFGHQWQKNDRTQPGWVSYETAKPLIPLTQHAHNLYLQVIVERGIGGLFALLLVPFSFMTLLYIRFKCNSPAKKMAMKIGILYLFFMLLSQFLSIFLRQNLETVIWGVGGLFVAISSLHFHELADLSRVEPVTLAFKKKSLRLLGVRSFMFTLAVVAFIACYRADFSISELPFYIEPFYSIVFKLSSKLLLVPAALYPQVAGVLNIMLMIFAYSFFNFALLFQQSIKRSSSICGFVVPDLAFIAMGVYILTN